MKRREFLRRVGGLAAAGAVASCAGAGPKPRAMAAERASDQSPAAPASGPLRVHPDNPRYFADASGRVVYLTGSHTWSNLVDMGSSDPPPEFDFAAYLDFLTRLNHNFIRMWTWESTRWQPGHWRPNVTHTVAPHPFARTGPGEAKDGKPKFDLTRYDRDYFDRLRTRVAAAGARGIYVSVMLFEGWGMQLADEGWETHPFHPANNVNGIDGDVNGDDRGLETHTLANRRVLALQEAYVRRVIDTVGHLDNVLYEISNENHPPSTAWQYHLIEYIHRYERERPKQHPVGMTFQYKGGSNQTLFDSPAEWVSPNPEGGYRDNPPAADGRKVVLTDTDHLWGIGGNQAWVWKSFLRGLNPLFMDPYDGTVIGNRFDPQWDPVRRGLGHTRRFAQRMNLATMAPSRELASTGYCLAHASPGKGEYLVYAPEGGRLSVDLSATPGKLAAQWFDPTKGTSTDAGMIDGGAVQTFTVPFTGDAVLWLKNG